MLNEDLAAKFEMCRAAAEVAAARVKLFELWVASERDAQKKGTE